MVPDELEEAMHGINVVEDEGIFGPEYDVSLTVDLLAGKENIPHIGHFHRRILIVAEALFYRIHGIQLHGASEMFWIAAVKRSIPRHYIVIAKQFPIYLDADFGGKIEEC